MISPEFEVGRDLPRDGSHAARVEWHARQRQQERAYAELCAMSTSDPSVCAATVARTERSLGLSNGQSYSTVK